LRSVDHAQLVEALSDPARRVQRNLARNFFGLAYRYAGGAERPSLVVLYGLMGSGKKTSSRRTPIAPSSST
jgi:hypothetical protein